jgi:hypothetical protein
VSTYDDLKKVLDGRLGEYNEVNAAMDLVLFQQASTRRRRGGLSACVAAQLGDAILLMRSCPAVWRTATAAYKQCRVVRLCVMHNTT